jgi:triosephosphate isomerase
LQQRQNGETEALLDQQIDAVLAKVGIVGFTDAVIAYEPVWAIGTGETASPEQAQAAHQFIREKLAAHDHNIAANLRILYGGSMKPENAHQLLSQTDIDGGLIGGAALKAESFVGICQAASAIIDAR